jgi:integrase
MRKGEVLGLLWNEVNFTNATIELSGERTKTGRPRTVPLDQLKLETLKDLYGRRQDEKNVFFHSFLPTKGRKKGKLKSGRIQQIRRAFHTACKKAKLEGLRIHDLRHTASTYTVKRHGIAKAQALLGHADIKTTQLYTHLDVEDLRQAVEDQASRIEEAPKPFYIGPLEKGATKGPSPA